MLARGLYHLSFQFYVIFSSPVLPDKRKPLISEPGVFLIISLLALFVFFEVNEEEIEPRDVCLGLTQRGRIKWDIYLFFFPGRNSLTKWNWGFDLSGLWHQLGLAGHQWLPRGGNMDLFHVWGRHWRRRLHQLEPQHGRARRREGGELCHSLRSRGLAVDGL